MSKQVFFLAAAVAALLACASPVDASFISNILTSGVNNTFEDNNREAIVDVNNNSTFDVGDVLLGFVRIDNKLPGGIAINNQIYSIFSQQVTAVVANGSNSDIAFGPTTVLGLRLSDIVVTAGATAMTAVYSSTTPLPVNLVTTSPGNLTGSATVNLFDYFASIQANSSLTLIAGFTDPEDYFQAQTDSANTAIGGLAGVIAAETNNQIGSFIGGLSIQFNADSAFVTYNDVVSSNHRAPGGAGPVLFTFHELTIAGGTINGQVGADNFLEWGNTNPDSLLANPGGTITNADFIVNPTVIPEPATMTMFSIGIVGLSAVGLLRRKKPVAHA